MKTKRKIVSCVGIVVLLFAMLPMTAVAFDFSEKSGNSDKDGGSNNNIATLILKNGSIYTMDAKGTVATAVVAINDKIVYVGDDDGIGKYAIGKDTKVIDLNGKMVTPGFVDAHIHAEFMPPSEGVDFGDIEMGTKPTLALYQEKLRDYAAAHPELKVIRGSGWQMDVFFPTKKPDVAGALDAAVSDRPVVIRDSAVHGTIFNTKGLALYGITKDSPVPPGGQIWTFDDGTPTGYTSDCWFTEPNTGETPTPPPTQQQIYAQIGKFQSEMNAKGITSIDGGLDQASEYKLLDDFSKTGNMTFRANLPLMLFNCTTEAAINAVKTLDDNQKYNSDYQKISQVKNLFDGVPEAKTAFMLEPYLKEDPSEPDYYGPQKYTQEDLDRVAIILNKAGYQVLTHAMGDGSARMCINAYEKGQRESGRQDIRNVIVHANLVAPNDKERMSQLKIYAAFQPIWGYNDNYCPIEKTVIGDRVYEEYALRSMLDAGMMLTGSADWSITRDNRPLAGMEVGMTQCSPYPGQQDDEATYLRNPDETATDVMELLKMYTINGAKQMRMEDKIGSLEVGKKADIVILEKDITKIEPKHIAETKIVNTIFDGRIVYEAVN